jgi:hypothetical protein
MTSWRVFWCWESGKYEFISWLGNIPAFIAWATTLVLSSLKWWVPLLWGPNAWHTVDSQS